MNNGIIKVGPINTKELVAINAEAGVIFENAKDMVITTHAGYELAAESLKIIKAKYNEIEAKRKEIVKPLDTARSLIQELFKKPLEFLKGAENSVKLRMVGWTDEQNRKRQAEEDKLRRKAEAEEKRKRDALQARAEKAEAKGDMVKAEELLQQAEEVHVEAPVLADTTPKVAGVSYRDNWKFRIIDGDLIPREFMIPDTVLLNKIAKAEHGLRKIPGIEFYSEEVISAGQGKNGG